MVEIHIGEKTINITFSKSNKIIKINGEPISAELCCEFEEQILMKKWADATEEEISEAIQRMGMELNGWLKHKDAWFNWKQWAENL